MSQRTKAAESQGMAFTKPFHWLLAVGVICSLSGLVFTRFPEGTSPAVQASAPDTSASTPESSGATATAEAVVTEASPVETPAVVTTAQPSVAAAETAVVGVVATPTPTMEAAPAANVQSLPALVEQPAELQKFPEKAWGLLDSMNEARRAEGLAQLEWDPSLEEVAYARARNLVTNGYFDHYAPDGESAFSELAARGIRYRLAGENLARNNYIETRTVAAAFDGLMNSPGHRANILEPRFSSVGVAAVRDGKMWIYVTVFLN
jgi:uncharacterized protein YkwD